MIRDRPFFRALAVRNLTPILTLSASLAVASLVGACGEGGTRYDTPDVAAAVIGSGTFDGSAPVAHVGFVQLVTSDNGVGREPLNFMSASFAALASRRAADAIVEYVEDGIPDGCEVFTVDASGAFNDEAGSTALEFGAIDMSAGELLVLSSPDRTLLELERDESGLYLGTSPFRPGQLPAGLTLDIPGDEFPGAADLSIAHQLLIEDFTLTTADGAASDGVVRPESVYRWRAAQSEQGDAGGAGGDDVIVVANSIDDDGMIESVICRVEDDGEFAFPEPVRALMSADFADDAPTLQRLRNEVMLRGETAVVVTRITSVSLGQ